ncbi:hypothetical protein SDC9_209765 [bioreactor metagenome]|uniref:DUF6591 domain-containing protein n=1 Tax=bioreactor metagenome TaxID=1076179 RepID=A0A645JH56_9ZZZZ
MEEKIIENITGGKVEVDRDKVTIETEDGLHGAIGGGDWPADQMGAKIPRLETGKVAFVANAEETCTLIIGEVAPKTFEDYLDKVTGAGFTAEELGYSSDDNRMYLAQDAAGVAITLNYEVKNEILNLSAVQENLEGED